MNIFFRAFNKEKNKIKLFQVSFYKHKLAIIHNFEDVHETYLPSIIEGIMEETKDEARIITTKSDQFTAIDSYREVIMENGEIKLSKETIP